MTIDDIIIHSEEEVQRLLRFYPTSYGSIVFSVPHGWLYGLEEHVRKLVRELVVKAYDEATERVKEKLTLEEKRVEGEYDLLAYENIGYNQAVHDLEELKKQT